MMKPTCNGLALLKRMAIRQRRLLVFWQNGGGSDLPAAPELTYMVDDCYGGGERVVLIGPVEKMIEMFQRLDEQMPIDC